MPSRVIRSFRYDPGEHRLEILFVSGRRYSYHDVPKALYHQMRGASSKGKFFNAHIRNRFRFTQNNSLRAV
jgi:lysyl-tRNA synthetase class 2